MMMKEFKKYLLILLLIPAFIFVGCKDDGDDLDPINPIEDSEFMKLSSYLVEEDMDLPAIISSWIVVAPAEADLATFLDTYDILDLRAGTDYDAGHIEGAVSTTLAGVLTAASGTTKPILVVCYTGQTAGHATVALRLSSYSDAVVLKWGMSGWNEATSDSWATSIGNAAGGTGSWVAPTGQITDPATFEAPALSTGATTGEAILTAQVTKMLGNGFKGVTNTAVLDDPGNYFINNYWAATDVELYGNITGAYRTNPLSIAGGEILNLDASEEVVTYCWTGQTSSMITAYLSVLGYNASSLKFGTNGMIYDDLHTHQYTVPTVNLPLVQ